MTVIAYDKPVKNLIPGLDATGHVTHTQHRKTHVTLHHNGGRLSHEGVLSVWQTRPASAHFDVDAYGAVAQYVRVNEYAWATGDTEGNQRSISIEMCNSGVGGDWPVGEDTWREAARLAAWLFARVIGVRPTSELVQHKFWSSTDCAGPYIGRIFNQILALCQYHYDVFTGSVVTELPRGEDMYFVGVIETDANGNFVKWANNDRYLCEGGLLTGGFTQVDIDNARADGRNGNIPLFGVSNSVFQDLRIKGEQPRLLLESVNDLLEAVRAQNAKLDQLLQRSA